MKKQKFTSAEHEKFKKYFGIKNAPGEWDLKYMAKTEKYIKYISWIPGIMMVGIGNSMAMNCSKKSSDIDLYIVTKNNSMWLVRILVTAIFQILGVRKTASKHAGRFCLSFFSTLNGMDFSKFALEKDMYLYFWIVYFKPLYNKQNTYEKFIEINNGWADFNPSPYGYSLLKKGETKGNQNTSLPFAKEGPEERGGWIRKNITPNSLLKKIFLPKTLSSYKKLGKPYGVIINDNLLKFHDNDIRKRIHKELN